MNPEDQSVNDEDKQQATQRLLFRRETMNGSTLTFVNEKAEMV